MLGVQTSVDDKEQLYAVICMRRDGRVGRAIRRRQPFRLAMRIGQIFESRASTTELATYSWFVAKEELVDKLIPKSLHV